MPFASSNGTKQSIGPLYDIVCGFSNAKYLHVDDYYKWLI